MSVYHYEMARAWQQLWPELAPFGKGQTMLLIPTGYEFIIVYRLTLWFFVVQLRFRAAFTQLYGVDLRGKLQRARRLFARVVVWTDVDEHQRLPVTA